MRARGKEVYIIAGVVAVVLIVAWYFLLFSPQRAKLSDLGNQITTANGSLETARQQVARLESYKATAPQARMEIVRLGKMLPESESLPSMMVELTRTAQVAGVGIDSITKGTTKLGAPFGIQAVTLQVKGQFFDVEDFLYRLESYVAFRNADFRVTGRLLDVSTLSVTRDVVAAGTSTTLTPLTVGVTLNGYLWSGAAFGPAPAGGTQ